MSIIYRPTGRAAEYSHLAINHYDGCGHRCKYCYVAGMPQWRDRDFFAAEPCAREDVIERLEQEAPAFAGTDERVLLCFTCDPYQPLDCSRHITREVIRILKRWQIPFQVLTKGGTRAAGDFDLYREGDAFATTMTRLHDTWSQYWEPFAALPANRIKAIELAKQLGIETWVSLEPVIDPGESLRIIERTHDCVDLYKIGKMNHFASIIDWRWFGQEAIKTCNKFGKPYYIKDDLAQYLNGVPYENVDTRKIKRPVQGKLFSGEKQ